MTVDTYELSRRLADRVNLMLSMPLTRKVVKKDGKVTIIKPANWTMATFRDARQTDVRPRPGRL